MDQEPHQQLKVTTMYVAHDQEEALTMSDRIAVKKAVLTDDPGSFENAFPGVVSDAIYLGSFTTYLVEVEGFPRKVIVQVQNTREEAPFTRGSRVFVGWNMENAPPLNKVS